MQCSYHPDKEAISKCSKCGRPLCEECGKSQLCIDCAVMPSKAAEEAGGIRLINWEGWITSFTSPKKALKNNIGSASYAGVAMNLLVGLVFAGALAFILTAAGKPAGGDSSITGAFGYTTQFIIFLCIWLAFAIFSYSLAMLLSGMGSFKQHMYIFSLFIPLSPLVIWVIAWVFSILLSFLALDILFAVLLVVYTIGIIIATIQETHRFGFVQSAISSIIPVFIICCVVGLLIVAPRK
jgi:hypothetical protein